MMHYKWNFNTKMINIILCFIYFSSAAELLEFVLVEEGKVYFFVYLNYSLKN